MSILEEELIIYLQSSTVAFPTFVFHFQSVVVIAVGGSGGGGGGGRSWRPWFTWSILSVPRSVQPTDVGGDDVHLRETDIAPDARGTVPDEVVLLVRYRGVEGRLYRFHFEKVFHEQVFTFVFASHCDGHVIRHAIVTTTVVAAAAVVIVVGVVEEDDYPMAHKKRRHSADLVPIQS